MGAVGVTVTDKPTIARESTTVPERKPRSVRRTTTIDITAPSTESQPVLLSGAGRDLFTGVDGRASSLAVASIRAEVAFGGARQLLELTAHPSPPELAQLLDVPLASAFRRVLDRVVPNEFKGGPLFLLLDDMPVTSLLAATRYFRPGSHPITVEPPPAEICVGWMSGGYLEQRVRLGIPLAVKGPVPPPALRRDDPDAWHDVVPLVPHQIRRRRRLDLAASREEGSPYELDAMFRDTYAEPDDTETVIHEYSVTGTIAVTGDVLSLTAHPHVLPGPQCPLAADFVHRLVGGPLSTMRKAVGRELIGTESCTHLNDALRSVGDLAGLLPYLA